MSNIKSIDQGVRGATATQNPGFPIDFECRSYNSVTHYAVSY